MCRKQRHTLTHSLTSPVLIHCRPIPSHISHLYVLELTELINGVRRTVGLPAWKRRQDWIWDFALFQTFKAYREVFTRVFLFKLALRLKRLLL